MENDASWSFASVAAGCPGYTGLPAPVPETKDPRCANNQYLSLGPYKVDSNAQRARWGADADTVVIGVVGRVDPAKGQDVFIKAAAGLLKGQRDGEKFKFVVVGDETRGAPSGYLDELKQMVQQFRLEDHVVFAGFQENIP